VPPATEKLHDIPYLLERSMHKSPPTLWHYKCMLAFVKVSPGLKWPQMVRNIWFRFQSEDSPIYSAYATAVQTLTLEAVRMTFIGYQQQYQSIQTAAYKDSY